MMNDPLTMHDLVTLCDAAENRHDAYRKVFLACGGSTLIYKDFKEILYLTAVIDKLVKE